IPAGALSNTLERCTKEIGWDSGGRLPTPPFHALGPVQPYVLTTHGGLRVSEQLEVLGAGGAPIRGLFAAGSSGRGGVLLPGHGHSLGWAFTSGRVAGRNAAATNPLNR